ncbi:MAG: ComEA family DNA-binding protein [Porticoccaceae bacterium]
MKVTVNQRYVLLVVLAIIFVLALLRGIMQPMDDTQSTAINQQMPEGHPKIKRPDSGNNIVVAVSKKPVHINSASATEIAAKLEGVGEAIADRIVQTRQEQGPYRNFEQLKAVSGLGNAKIEANKQKIRFD